MKAVVLCLLLLLLFPAVALAQEPTPAPPDTPYDFQPIDYQSGEENPAIAGLGDIVVSVPFINRFGSIAVTVWDMLDKFAGGGVLGYLVIILLGLVVIRWVASFVYNKPIKEQLDVSKGADIVGEFNPDLGLKTRSFVRLIKNRPRF